MQFQGKSKEFIILGTINSLNCAQLKEKIPSTLTALWNTHDNTLLRIDGEDFVFERNQVVFLTEFHQLEVINIDEARLIRFNRDFFCIVDHDSEVSCKGVLFFGASTVPVFQIPQTEFEKFELLWQAFRTEMESKDEFQLEMLRIMLKRFLILSTRTYKLQNPIANLEINGREIVREFNFLVEQYFRTKNTVSEYANLLNKSPKTISNLFSKISGKTPLQIIQERKILEAKRLLQFTDKPIKEIAYDLSYKDIQTFSRFFKSHEGVGPSEYKEFKISGKIAKA